MINYIVGKLVNKENNIIVLDKDGIGFNIYFPESSFYNINIDEDIKVYIHIAFSQDDISLYGFLTEEDKEMFQLLLKVNRLGPKSAMSIISNLGCIAIKNAILKKDSKKFSSLSGIGQKVADKIIIDLFDKMKNFDLGIIDDTNNVKDELLEIKNEAIEALVALGYNKKLAEELVNKVELTKNMKADELIKLALKK